MEILEQSLCLLQGVSHETEIRLRHAGVLTCAQLARDADRYFSARHAQRIRDSFAEWQVARTTGLVDWVVGHLPVGHRVRALSQCRNDVLFFDIETDGKSPSSNITCISTMRNGAHRSFWRGHNLSGFLAEWASAKILVGFNSKRFDTPFVCKAFGLTAIPPQIDLMDEVAHYGYRGGLKTVERKFGVSRKAKGCDDGNDAIRRWAEYTTGRSEDSLAALLAYNREDVESLVALSKAVLCLSLENTLIIDN
jgi:uncharacterized protein YprB with RNaseH-like and TPR domain